MQLQWFEDAQYFGFLDNKNHIYHIFSTDGTPITLTIAQFSDVESTDDPNVLLGIHDDGNTQDLVRLTLTGDQVTQQILTTNMVKGGGSSFDRQGNEIALVILKSDYASRGVDIVDINTGHLIPLNIDSPHVVNCG